MVVLLRYRVDRKVFMHRVRFMMYFLQFYQSFFLSSLVTGAGYPGRYTKTRGFLSYYEVNISIKIELIELFVIRSVNMNILKAGKKYG